MDVREVGTYCNGETGTVAAAGQWCLAVGVCNTARSAVTWGLFGSGRNGSRRGCCACGREALALPIPQGIKTKNFKLFKDRG